MRVNFILLAGGTALNVLVDEGSESQPPELSGDQLTGFKETGMAGGLMVMALFEDGTAKRIISGNVDTAFICEDTGLNLPVSKAGVKGERDVRVHRLKCLQDEGIAGGSRLNAVRKGSVNEVDKEGRWEEGDIIVVGVIQGEEVRAVG